MALSINPSENFRGNDGNWSTFFISVGLPPQAVEVLPGTSLTSNWVVTSQGCPPGAPSDCATSRGGFFTVANDKIWQPEQQWSGASSFALPFYDEAEANLPGYSGAASVGLSDLSMQWNGTSQPSGPLRNQVIVPYGDSFPWLGFVGLDYWENHIGTAVLNGSVQGLTQAGAINSISWGYTAGASYHNPPAVGSLTLGGYDSARVNMSSSLKMPMNYPADTNRDLLVAVNHIEISSSDQTTIVPVQPFMYMLDSTVTDIWLPSAAYQTFESVLGLQWNDTLGIYLINDTQHANLLQMSPNFTFYLGSALSSTSGQINTTTVTLPYAAFDLNLTYPMAGISDNSQVRYFPIKRAANDSSCTQCFLGRTFFQEAYVTADYNSTTLTVGQALFPLGGRMSIVETYPPIHKSSLSTGGIAGVAVGGAALVTVLVALAVWFFWWRPRQRKQKDVNDATTYRSGSLTGATIFGEFDSGVEMERFQNPPKDEPLSPRSEYYDKPELDASETARAEPTRASDRYELDAATAGSASARPRAGRDLSWGSQDSAVSSMGHERERVTSLMSAFSQPSPPIHQRSGSQSPLPEEAMLNEPRFSESAPRGPLFELG